MNEINVKVSAVIKASPKRIYRVISDYHEGHQAILPPRYFTAMKVLEGGQGAGTVVEVAMNVMGAKRLFRLQVSEPDPGRVLVEADPDSSTVTTFTIDAANQGEESQVTIETRSKASSGLRGFMEKLFNPSITRRIYKEELNLLANYVQTVGANED